MSLGLNDTSSLSYELEEFPFFLLDLHSLIACVPQTISLCNCIFRVMNYFTDVSIQLANQRNYLDLLFAVYPLVPETVREIDEKRWAEIERFYNSKNNQELFKSLLKMPLFPVKDGYMPFFKRDPSAVYRNPQTVNRICGRIREFSLNELYEKCSQPKETNRQMGPLFRRWINSGKLGIFPVNEETFISTKENAILDGSDKSLMEFAKKHLGYTRNKGVDFIARFNGKYVVGEAKFISDEGGHQNDQFLDAMTTLKSCARKNVIYIAILDGVLYIKSKKKMYTEIAENDVPVMSALVLKDFLYSL